MCDCNWYKDFAGGEENANGYPIWRATCIECGTVWEFETAMRDAADAIIMLKTPVEQGE